MSVTLYTKPNCPGCKLSKQILDEEKIPYETKDLTLDPEAYKHVTENLGYSSAPVVQWEGKEGTVGGNFAGFKPDKLREIKAYV